MYRGPPCIASNPEHSEPIDIVIAIAPSRSTIPSEHLRCPHSRVAVGLLLSLVTRPIRSAAGRLACGPSPLSASMFDARCYAFDARREREDGGTHQPSALPGPPPAALNLCSSNIPRYC
jgi:hypothetical protein